MKILLACLMCLVLGASQCFAISGGPGFGGGGQVSVTGTYAGVFVPIPTVLDPGPPPVTLTDVSLALFTLSVPSQGLAKGTVAIFRNGKAYTGDIQASANPDSGAVSGVISAIHTQMVAAGDTTVTFVFNELANGILRARVTANTKPFSSATARLTGHKSSISYTTPAANPDQSGNSGGPILYKIQGFKQSQTSS